MNAADRCSTAAGPLRFAPDVVIRKVGDEAIALKLSKESVYALNDTAARVALLIEAGNDPDAIVTSLASEYATSRDLVAAHVATLIADFAAKGLIEGAWPRETA